MKKGLKIFGIIAAVLAIGIFIAYKAFDKPLPEGEATPEADIMANKMLTAINKSAWDETKTIKWSFRGARHFVWDKERHLVQVKWDNYEAYINPGAQTGIAFEEGTKLAGSKSEEVVKQAIDNFNNDSFWLNAPAKVFDGGTERSIITEEDGRQGLMVKYASGGTTPGDSYLWFLDESGMPTSYKMWVSIIPVGGMEVTWEDWKTLPSGAKIAQNHKGSKLEIPITNIESAESLESLGMNTESIVYFDEVAN